MDGSEISCAKLSHGFPMVFAHFHPGPKGNPLEESLMGVRTVSAFGTERFQQQRFEEQLGRARKGGVRSGIRRLGRGWGVGDLGMGWDEG